MKKVSKNLIVCMSILFVMLVVSIVFNVLGGLNLKNTTVYNREIGDDYTLNIKDNVSVVSFMFDGSTLLNQVIKQNFSIVFDNFIKAKNVSVKVEMEGANIELKTDTLWKKDSSFNSYTYLGQIEDKTPIKVFEEFVVLDNVNLKQNYCYVFNVIVKLDDKT